MLVPCARRSERSFSFQGSLKETWEGPHDNNVQQTFDFGLVFVLVYAISKRKHNETILRCPSVVRCHQVAALSSPPLAKPQKRETHPSYYTTSLIYLCVRQAAGCRVADVVHLLINRPLVLALLPQSLPRHHDGDGALCH
jgi:hypothetical protein